MTKGRFTLEIQPDIATAVDLHVCRRAALYAGNVYSVTLTLTLSLSLTLTLSLSLSLTLTLALTRL